MNNLIDFNYQVTKKRNLISDMTNNRDFANKLKEEVNEFLDALFNENGSIKYELADIVLVCMNFAKHNGIDLEKQLLTNILKNVNRI